MPERYALSGGLQTSLSASPSPPISLSVVALQFPIKQRYKRNLHALTGFRYFTGNENNVRQYTNECEHEYEYTDEYEYEYECDGECKYVFV